MFRSTASSIKLKPLLPTSDDTISQPQCSILKLEDLTLLLDCGGTLDFSTVVVDAVAPYAAEIDAVVISSCEMCCCGSLPMVLPLLRPGVRVFASMATARLAVMTVTAQFLSQFGNADSLMARLGNAPERRSPPPPQNLSIKSIYSAFRNIREVHFDQTVTIVSLLQQQQQAEAGASAGAAAAVASASNNNEDNYVMADEIHHASVRAVSAGRVVGGSGFRIKYRDDDILYMARFSPRDTFVIPGINTQSALLGANILICDGSAANVDDVRPMPTTDTVLRTIRDTLRKGGSVLAPVNAFGVGIEIMQRIETFFAEEALAYQLVFASPKAKEHVDRLRLLSEFALPSVNWGSQEGPLSTYTLINSVSELSSMNNAKCVVLHSLDLKDGLASSMLKEFGKDQRNLILFTDTSGKPSSVQEALVQLHQQSSAKKEMSLRTYVRTLLEGEELEAFLQEDRARRDAEDAAARLEQQRLKELEAYTEHHLLMIGDEDEDEDEEQGEVKGGRKKASVQKKTQTEQTQSTTVASSSPASGAAAGAGAQSAYQHPNLYIAPTFDVKKRTRSGVLNFPGELSSGSTRTLHDFGSLEGAEEDAIYGIPVSDNDLRRFSRFAAEATFRVGAMSSLHQQQQDSSSSGSGARSSETADEIPAYIREVTMTIKCNARVETFSTTQWLDGTSLRVILRNNCKQSSVRKIAFLHTSTHDARALTNFCSTEEICKRGGVTCPVVGDEIDLATAVYSCEIRVHPDLLMSINSSQRPVETASGLWRVAWARGVLVHPQRGQQQQHRQQQKHQQKAKKHVLVDEQGNVIENVDPDGEFAAALVKEGRAQRRPRMEDEGGDAEKNQEQEEDDALVEEDGGGAGAGAGGEDSRPVLCPIDQATAQQLLRQQRLLQQQQAGAGDAAAAAAAEDDNHDVGSIFVGELRLPQIERDLINNAHIREDLIEHVRDEEAPLMVVNNAVAIRGGNGLAMEAVPSAAMFAARRAFRASFSHIL